MGKNSKSKDKQQVIDNGIGSYESAKRVFLWLMAVTYFFAFGSIYFQYPGLFGENGLIPARTGLKQRGSPGVHPFWTRPSVVWFHAFFGLNAESMLELVVLAGLVLSLLCIVFKFMRNGLIFASLWILYLSLYWFGEVFMFFQWDILLLEAGFITILLAPIQMLRLGGKVRWSNEKLPIFLLRWLLFRLMFGSGVVKLKSHCETWWGLTALNHHFESQCIPTPLAWYAHHLPNWVLQLGVVGTFLIEIPIPFLIFSPVRALRIFTFYAQLMLQVAIALTGNYNFFNFLTVALCIPLLDDRHLQWKSSKKDAGRKDTFYTQRLGKIHQLLVLLILSYITFALFSVRLNPDLTVESKIAFNFKQFDAAVDWMIYGILYASSFIFVYMFARALYEGFVHSIGFFSKLRSIFSCFIIGAIAFYLYCISQPQFIKSLSSTIEVWPVIDKWHRPADQFNIVNSYGLFRRMTGVNGRPEIVIEGSDSLEKGWKEYHFQYKPGNLSQAPAFLAPHHPRLDWQMWFAALGDHKSPSNAWFTNLVYRLLHGQPEVLDLLDKERNPFPKSPPKYIRAIRYLYSFTKPNDKLGNWWTRSKSEEFFPAVSKSSPALKQLIDQHDALVTKVSSKPNNNQQLRNWMNLARQWICSIPPTIFLWSAFAPLFVVNLIRGA